jgi:hypothetical protein
MLEIGTDPLTTLLTIIYWMSVAEFDSKKKLKAPVSTVTGRDKFDFGADSIVGCLYYLCNTKKVISFWLKILMTIDKNSINVLKYTQNRCYVNVSGIFF